MKEKQYKESVIERNQRIGTAEKIAYFKVKQQLPYECKVQYAELRAREFETECAARDLNTHVSVGGLDSITLLLFLRSIGIDPPAISASSLEDKSIQKIHKMLGVETVKPLKSKVEILKEYGYPILSKEIAGKIGHLQNPTENNATVRHAIITGETGAYGGEPNQYPHENEPEMARPIRRSRPGGCGARLQSRTVQGVGQVLLLSQGKAVRRLGKGAQFCPLSRFDGKRGRSQRKKPDDEWMQLFREIHHSLCAVRYLLTTGFVTACT